VKSVFGETSQKLTGNVVHVQSGGGGAVAEEDNCFVGVGKKRRTRRLRYRSKGGRQQQDTMGGKKFHLAGAMISHLFGHTQALACLH